MVVWDFFHQQYHGYILIYIISYGYMRNLLPPPKKSDRDLAHKQNHHLIQPGRGFLGSKQDWLTKTHTCHIYSWTCQFSKCWNVASSRSCWSFTRHQTRRFSIEFRPCPFGLSSALFRPYSIGSRFPILFELVLSIASWRSSNAFCGFTTGQQGPSWEHFWGCFERHCEKSGAYWPLVGPWALQAPLR